MALKAADSRLYLSLGVFRFPIDPGGHTRSLNFLVVVSASSTPFLFSVLFFLLLTSHSPSFACRHFGSTMKVQLVIIHTVATDPMVVATHSPFLSWSIWSGTAIGSMASNFPRCVSQATNTNLATCTLKVCVTPPLAPGIKDKDTVVDTVGPAHCVIAVKWTVEMSVV